MPSMAGTLGLGGLWEPFAAPAAVFLEDWLALQYLLPLISFVCVGLEGWCFFDLTRKTLGARSAARGAAAALTRDDASSLEYDVVKDFPNGGFEPSNNQLCIQGLLGIKLHARHSTACLSNPANAGQSAKGLTVPCGCLIITKGRSQTPRIKRRQRMAYIAI